MHDRGQEVKDEEVTEGIVLTTNEGGIERELFGKWTVTLRNAGGFFAVVVVCIMGLFNCYTTYVSVNDHQKWPTELSVFIMVVGPVICSWSWMNVNKTIGTILGGVGEFDKFRERAARMIAPSKKD